MTIEICLNSSFWNEIELSEIAHRALAEAFKVTGLAEEEVSLTVLATDDAEIADLNAQFREKPSPTNVLSWPVIDLSPEIAGAQPEAPEADVFGEIELGDIAISYETCAREAREAGKPLRDHVTHLIVHGLLHLLGYDHIRDPDATVMQGLEVEILGRLGIDNPYWDMDGV